jgi:hypothetical protein
MSETEGRGRYVNLRGRTKLYSEDLLTRYCVKSGHGERKQMCIKLQSETLKGRDNCEPI